MEFSTSVRITKEGLPYHMMGWNILEVRKRILFQRCGKMLSWIRFINTRIAKYTNGIFENVRSHSFRVNYATSLLKHAPLEQVAEIIGHRDIKTTLRYNRYRANREECVNWIVKAL